MRAVGLSSACALLIAGGSCSSARPVPTVAAPVPSATTPPLAVAPAVDTTPVLVTQRFRAGDLNPKTLGLSPSGKLILMGASDGLLVVDADSGAAKGVLPGCYAAAAFAGSHVVALPCQVARAVDADVDDLLARPGSPVGLHQQPPAIWDLATDTHRDVVTPPHSTYNKLRVSPGGDRFLLIGSSESLPAVDLVDVLTGACTTPDHDDFDPTGGRISASGRILLERARHYRVVEADGRVVFVPPSAPGNAIALSPDGKRLADVFRGRVTLIDVDSKNEIARVSACPDGKDDEAVAWTDDGEHVIVSCTGSGQGPEARVTSLSKDGQQEGTLVDAGAAPFRIEPHGGLIAMSNEAEGARVVSLDGKELYRLPSAGRSVKGAWFSSDASRTLLLTAESAGDRTAPRLDLGDRAGTTNVAQELHLIAPAPTEPVAASAKAPGHGLIYADSALVDPEHGRRYAPWSKVSADGTTLLGSDGAGAFLLDRATDTRQALSSGIEKYELSAGGGYLVQTIDSYEHAGLALVDRKTGQVRREYHVAGARITTSADDRLVVLAQPTFETGDFNDIGHVVNRRLCRPSQAKCVVLHLFDVLAGRELAVISPDTPEGVDASRVEISSNGRIVYDGGNAFEARTGKSLWKAGAGARPQAFLAQKGVWLIASGEAEQVVDAVTGKVLRPLDPIDEVAAVSDDGAWVVALRKGAAVLYRTDDWSLRPLPSFADLYPVGFSSDAKAIYFATSRRSIERLVALRIADGARLRFDAELNPWTDDGEFDPAHPPAVAVRMGKDIEHSAMVRFADWAGAHSHPKLAADFFGGRPIAPLGPSTTR